MAAGWLQDYLNIVGGSKASKLKILYTSEGLPRTTIWTLPETLQPEHSGASLESVPTAPAVPTGVYRDS
jgi:hypothetical protein